ncbi:MAG: hypothetical protein ACE5EV_00015 [Gaiellales bacterium]
MVETDPQLDQGRDCYERYSWSEARTLLLEAEQAAALGAEDLERLATSCYMLGLEEDYARNLERAHRAHLEEADTLGAVRCAFWLGITLALRGEMGQATGWIGRAQRMVERQESRCVEEGYLLLPVMLQQEASGSYEAVQATAARAIEIGEGFDDADLLALALHEQGRALAKQGRIDQGLGLLDEAMVAVVAGELEPIVTGLVY